MSLRHTSPMRDGSERDRRRSDALSKANPPRPDSGTPRPTAVPRARGRKGMGASSSQRAKRGFGPCIVTGLYTDDIDGLGQRVIVDAAHLWPRSKGGCADPDCIVPLTRGLHRLFDAGEFNLLPHLIAAGCIPEMQHAIAHANGDLITLINRLTGSKYTAEGQG